jgi:FlaA1/EpsC-like NDP-sugar epimerase
VTNTVGIKLLRFAKILVAFLVDIFLCLSTVWVAFYLRLGQVVDIFEDGEWNLLFAMCGSIIIAIPIFIASGFYRAVFRHSGWHALTTIIIAVTLYGLIFAIVFMIFGVAGVPRTIGIIQPILLLLGLGGSRLFARIWLSERHRTLFKHATNSRVLIYGAGAAGRELASGLSSSHNMRVVGFIDDNFHLHGRIINGVRVYNPVELVDTVDKLSVSDVLLAMPSISRRSRSQILKKMLDLKVSVRTLPSLSDLVQGKVSVSDLTDLDLDDLLAREAHEPDQHLLSKNIRAKVVMVTGAGGSIGSELCRQIANLKPTKFLLCEQSEYALYALHQELIAKHPLAAHIFVPLLVSVRDQPRLDEIMSAWRPNTIYHAAAYKHVPLVELNLVEGILNNTFGTLAITRAAVKAGVSDFVLVSTDKAVRPTNMMGASKRLAEMVLQAISHEKELDGLPNQTCFSMVRFGNVLGSSGSVVPKFREQIRNGGPLTLTHPDITRYFMTITEAAQLVIQASAMATGGDVFVLDMHEPIKIKDLAIRMIKLSGRSVCDEESPDGDIEIAVTGLRPGEKLFEELLIGNNPEATEHSGIMKAREAFLPWPDLQSKLNRLKVSLAQSDVQAVRSQVADLVPGYVLHEKIVDLLFTSKSI